MTFSNSGSNSLINVLSGSQTISAPVVLAGSLTVNPSQGATLNISGTVSQSGGNQPLTLNGPGTLVLSGSNTFSGGTTINSGTLQIGAGGATGTPGTGPITDYYTLAVSRSDAYTFPVGISGAGQLVQLGPGA